MSILKEEQNDSKRKASSKKSNIREIMNIKSLMDKRKQQRALTIYNLANLKFQNALIIARQLLFTSQKIWKEFSDEFREEFQQNYFFRTSKDKEHTQYLLDSVIICKVFVKSKKKDDILQIVQKLELPAPRIIKKTELVNREIILYYNEMKQILARTCSALLSFIQILKQQKLYSPIDKIFQLYINFIKTYYGPLEYATGTFVYANYLFQIQQFKKAIQMYNTCLNIRKQNCLNEAFVDVLINSSICMKQIGRITEAIERVKLAIEISKDLKNNQQPVLDEYHLLLAKLYLQNGSLNQAYKNYQITYKLRQKLDSQDPKKVQIELNMLYFYKMLQKMTGENSEQCFNLKDKKEIENCKKQAHQIMKDMVGNIFNREQFTKYDDFNKKMAHLTLYISQPFFDLLSAEQVIELTNLLQKIASCSFQKGLHELQKCSFFEEKKTRDLLMTTNPAVTYNPKNFTHNYY